MNLKKNLANQSCVLPCHPMPERVKLFGFQIHTQSQHKYNTYLGSLKT